MLTVTVGTATFYCDACHHTNRHEVLTPSIPELPTTITCSRCGWVR